jgi:hypothetical protein
MKNLTFIVISKDLTNKEDIDLYEKAYSFWKSEWKEILKESFSPDTFYRQKYICLLYDGMNIVALSLHSRFRSSSQATIDHSYFKFYPKIIFNKFESSNSKIIYTFESLTISKEYRKTILSRLFPYIVFNFLNSIELDAVIAPTMKINGVNKLAKQVGMEIIASDIIYKSHFCDIAFYQKSFLRPLENEFDKSLFKHIWENKVINKKSDIKKVS